MVELSNKRAYMMTGGLITVTLVTGAMLSSACIVAESDVTKNASVTVSSSCSMTGSSTSHVAGNVSNGTVVSDIGLATIKVTCNDSDGFSVYAIGYTDDTDGKNVLTNAGIGPNFDIATSTSTSGSSSWAMKLATNGSATYPITIQNNYDSSSYHAVPNDYELVAKRLAATDTGAAATGASFTSTYQVYIDDTQPAGTYTGKVKYVMIHPNNAVAPLKPLAPLDEADCPANSICYVPNYSDIVGSMSSLGTTARLTEVSPQAGTISATIGAMSNSTATLIASNYKRDGYGFAGWSEDLVATSASTIYGPNETISIGDLSTNGKILYPVWVASAGVLQNWSGCDSLTPANYNTETGALTATLASVTALKDRRDDNVYAVARLADGYCWTIENLRLGDTVSAATMASGSQGIGSGFSVIPTSSDSWNGSSYTLAQFNKNNTNIGGKNASNMDLVPSYNGNTDTAQWYGYGNYYSWSAAIADTAPHDGGFNSTTSICPAGWSLSLGGVSSGNIQQGASDSNNLVRSFSYLDRKMGGTGASDGANAVTSDTMSLYWRKFPNNIINSGLWSANTPAHARGGYGLYWTASAYNPWGAYDLLSDVYYLKPGSDNNVTMTGGSVRCVSIR